MTMHRFALVILLLLLCLPCSSKGADATARGVPADSDGVQGQSDADLVPIELPEIVTEETFPQESSESPANHVRKGRLNGNSEAGSVDRMLQDQLPYHFSSNGSAGSLSQIRGIGASAEDTRLEALGIPLNSPQGGGMDLSVFPSYFWSDYAFQLSPSSSDPRGASGSLSLTPWTDSALARESGSSRFYTNYSDQGARALALGTVTGVGQQWGKAAAIAGYSDGKARGPSAMLSVRSARSADVTTGFHLLATRLDVDLPPLAGAPPSRARQSTQRLIPVGQLGFRAGKETRARTTFYYDDTRISYRDPDSPPPYQSSSIAASAWGSQNELYYGPWRLQGNAKQVLYISNEVAAPEELLFQLELARAFASGALWYEPALNLSSMSRFGIEPGGGLGVRLALNPEQNIFTRMTHSARYPSLVDRFYTGERTFSPNPKLGVEHDSTVVLGTELSRRSLRASLESYAQLREDAQVASEAAGVRTMGNAGRAWVAALTGSVSADAAPQVTLSDAATLAQSRILLTSQEFPYVPRWVNVLSVSGHSRGENPPYRVGASFRVSSGANADSAGRRRVSGYGYFDLEAAGRVDSLLLGSRRRPIELAARIENLLDRKIEFTKDYPSAGRTLLLTLAGEF